MAMRGIKNLNIDSAMQLMYRQVLKRYENAKLTFIEKGKQTIYPFIIFTIEVPQVVKQIKPQSQIWHITSGKQALYVDFISVKKAKLTSKQIKEWSKFFKTGVVVEVN